MRGRLTFFIALLSISLVFAFGATASAANPVGHSSIQATISGEVPGCPPAHHVGDLRVPADGGSVYKPAFHKKNGAHKAPLAPPAIAHLWWNNDSPSVKNASWNPGQPYWNQTLIKVKIPVKFHGRYIKGVRFVGAGGEYWQYVNNSACRHNLQYEFRNGNQPVHTLSELLQLGLVKIYYR